MNARNARQTLLDVVSRGPKAVPRDLASGMILYLENLTVSFDGFKALDALTLYVEPGELRCIIGPKRARRR
jgi:urea transport system ATP-binding protein